jgi:hypothetical protein
VIYVETPCIRYAAKTSPDGGPASLRRSSLSWRLSSFNLYIVSCFLFKFTEL